MKRIITILVLSVVAYTAAAQVVFKAILPAGPFIEGESFPVQFVLEDINGKSEFTAPDFSPFRVVSGPYIYAGTVAAADGIKQLKNIIYTIEATRPGSFVLDPATARVDGNLVRTTKLPVQVISRAEAAKLHLLPENNPAIDNSAAILRDGEDPYEKISKNLYVKVQVDKKTSFIGEPVTATFKLYSRLQSRSDIVKNPGFYGFTVQDMLDLEDNVVATEIINGKKFDVHTIRKVQLYPLRAGSFTIDAMEIENKVKLSGSVKKSRQEIVEGIFPGQGYGGGEQVYETTMSTGTITINVKPYPDKNIPADFTGATGDFYVDAVIEESALSANEEGHLDITISGKGNFTQLTPPVIHWPEGIEGFQPETKDYFDNTHTPLTGKRTFRFPFVPARSGSYTIPAIRFSFFDPDTNRYKTVSTSSPGITVAPGAIAEENTVAKNRSNPKSSLIGVIAVMVVIAAVAGGWVWAAKRKKKQILPEAGEKKRVPAVTELLQPARLFQSADNKAFYALLRNCIWQFFSIHFDLSGSAMSRQQLSVAMQQNKTDEAARQTILAVLAECETGIFTDAVTEIDRQALLAKTLAALEQVEKRYYRE